MGAQVGLGLVAALQGMNAGLSYRSLLSFLSRFDGIRRSPPTWLCLGCDSAERAGGYEQLSTESSYSAQGYPLRPQILAGNHR